MAGDNEKGVDRRETQILRLKDYVEQMAYKPVKPPSASERTEELTKTRKRTITGTYDEHKDSAAKERMVRVGRLVAKHKAITTQQLKDIVQEHRRKQHKSELDEKQHAIIYHEILAKFQKQCEDQVMKEIVNKFARELSRRAVSPLQRSVETEWYKRLQKSLVCNMILALKVPNSQQGLDYTIYNKLAVVLADLILQALFLAQNTQEDGVCAEREPPPDVLPENTEKYHCIQFRALRAAKKKLHHRRQKRATFGGSVCSKFY